MSEPKAWYRAYESGPKGDGFVKNCANSGIDMLVRISEECPEGFGTLESVIAPPKPRGRPKKNDSSD